MIMNLLLKFKVVTGEKELSMDYSFGNSIRETGYGKTRYNLINKSEDDILKAKLRIQEILEELLK